MQNNFQRHPHPGAFLFTQKDNETDRWDNAVIFFRHCEDRDVE